MSKRYPGGFITKTAPQPTGGETGTAPGVWTLEQAMEYQKAGTWPSPPIPVYVEDVFSTNLYTDNSSTQAITNNINISGKGGLVWIKARSAAASHALFDTNRGATYGLVTNLTSASVSDFGLSAFSSSGFTVTTGGFNTNSANIYTSWTFREQAKFFDIVTYTGNGTTQAINHNLGSVPGCIIVKRTDSTSNWAVYHRYGDSSGNWKGFRLNTTDAAVMTLGSGNYTSTTFVVGQWGDILTGDANDNTSDSGATYIAYLFAHDAGGFGLTGTDNVIQCSSFENAGSGFHSVNIGWEPQWLLVKNATGTSTTYWQIYDNLRGITGENTSGNSFVLRPNATNAESDNSIFQITATGFRYSGGAFNPGDRIIYVAIRRGPMKTPTSGTSVFSPIASNAAAGTKLTTNFPVDLQLAAFRTFVDNKRAMDRLRGLTTSSTQINPALLTNSTAAEAGTTSTYTSGMDNTGFNMSTEYGGSSSIFWNFRRAPGFFDMVCYTGTGSTQTINHNLSVAPELLITKKRSSSDNWGVYLSTLGANSYLLLDATIAAQSPTNYYNNTSPTSSVFTVRSGGAVNDSGQTYVAYLFATVAGVSKVGSYTGTGTTLQVNCGFTGGSRFVLIKRTDSTGDWYVWDSARGIIAGNDPYLLLNSTAAEVTNTDYVDTYSAGFEISSTAPAGINANGGTYIFLAIA